VPPHTRFGPTHGSYFRSWNTGWDENVLQKAAARDSPGLQKPEEEKQRHLPLPMVLSFLKIV